MTEKDAQLHLYFRDPIDPNGEDSLAKLARKISPGTTVLDIGCAVGVLGHYLTEEKHCVVDGIEANAKAADLACSFYRQVWVSDLETTALADILKSSLYQFIVCADILEHLRDPGRLLGQIANFLAPGGKLLVSIPNVGHMGVLLELLSGDFRYREEGLLDKTHLRFFTQRSFLRLLTENGFTGRVVDRTIVDIQRSEFSDSYPETVSPALFREMQGWHDSITYQFIVEAYPQVAEANASPFISIDQSAPLGPRFVSQIFWRCKEESFIESRSQCHYLPIGIERQRITFMFPKGAAHSLRFDPSDRKGFLHLYSMRLLDNTKCLWTWDGDINTLLRGTIHSIVPTPLTTEKVGAMLTLLDNDPWLELSLPPDVLSYAEFLEVELSWPMSADFLAVKEEWKQSLKQNQRLASELDAIYQSRLWKLTKPIRLIIGTLHSSIWTKESSKNKLNTDCIYSGVGPQQVSPD